MKFKVILEPDFEDGGYIASCPSLPGCHSQGDTEGEALKNIEEAIIGYLKSLRKYNQPIPHEAEVDITMAI